MQPNGEEAKDDFLMDKFPSVLERIEELTGLMHEERLDIQFWGDTFKAVNTAVGLPRSLRERLAVQAKAAKNTPLGHKWATTVDEWLDGGILKVSSDPVALLAWASKTENPDSEDRFLKMAGSILKEHKDPAKMLIEPPLFVNGVLAGSMRQPFNTLAKLANTLGDSKVEFATAFLLGSLDVDIENKEYISEFLEDTKLSVSDLQKTKLYQDCLSGRVKLNLLTPAEMCSVFEEEASPLTIYENTSGN